MTLKFSEIAQKRVKNENFENRKEVPLGNTIKLLDNFGWTKLTLNLNDLFPWSNRRVKAYRRTKTFCPSRSL